jgi:hypothetical protein
MNVPKALFCILKTDIALGLQKLGIILEQSTFAICSNGHKYNCTLRLIRTESAQSSESQDLSLLHSGPEDIFEVLRTKTFKS